VGPGGAREDGSRCTAERVPVTAYEMDQCHARWRVVKYPEKDQQS